MVPGVARTYRPAGLTLKTWVGRSRRSWTAAVARLAGASVLALLISFGFGAAAMADTDNYSETQTIPVPPASNYAGSGGGDGWAVALSDTQVFNVLHHSGSLNVVRVVFGKVQRTGQDGDDHRGHQNEDRSLHKPLRLQKGQQERGEPALPVYCRA